MRSRIACRRVRDWPIALEQKNMSSSSSCPWGPLALEQKKYTSSLSWQGVKLLVIVCVIDLQH
jgi:hypothetical protein